MTKSILMFQMTMMMSISFLLLFIQILPSNNMNLHPLILMMNLFIMLIMSSFNLSMFMKNHWFSFIMFLIIVGGMMVIFMYFISFTNNMKTSIKLSHLMNLPIKIIMFTISLIVMIYNMYYNLWFMNYNEILSINSIMLTKFQTNELSLLYMYPKNITTILSMMYLLLNMTMIVKICLNKKLTLRKFN